MGRISRNILPDLERREHEAEKPENHRRHGRLHVQKTPCSIGTVIDLSCSGMRVSTKFKMKPSDEMIGLRLEGLDGPMLLPCKVVWVRRSGFRRWTVGVEFAAMTQDQRKALSELARSVSRNECLCKETRRAG
ncbi:MAG TPA: PilZ domain-containing protein [Phycisphaerales bacterium]|nr:PilZ domain-containing protein [Phycisphaerales bacterium]